MSFNDRVEMTAPNDRVTARAITKVRYADTNSARER